MLVKVKPSRTLFTGNRTYTEVDGVFSLPDDIAGKFVKSGLVDVCVEMDRDTSQRAVDRKPEAARR